MFKLLLVVLAVLVAVASAQYFTYPYGGVYRSAVGYPTAYSAYPYSAYRSYYGY